MFEHPTVFADGATLDSAEDVCAGEGVARADVAEILAHLVDKSLVRVNRREGTARYTMLQTLVEYGREHLEVLARHS